MRVCEWRSRILTNSAYAQLYNSEKVRKYLNQQRAEELIHALAHSHVVYCNAKFLIREFIANGSKHRSQSVV